MEEVILDGLLDTLKLIPFLLLSFLIIELIEHKLKSDDILIKTGKFGPLFGGLLGIIPQCGFASIATNLYITRIISLGTLIAVYLSTSDEMLPILISENVEFGIILKILGTKLLIGVIAGFIIDLFYRQKNKHDYHLCKEEHCHCKESIFKSAIIHTFNIAIFILIINLILNLVFYLGLEEYLNSILLKDNIFAPVITCLVGLIPNCASSVIITKLYLNFGISFGSLIGGLLTNSGVGLLILFKNNKNLKENILIITIVFIVGLLSGIILNMFTFL